ncbi:UNVERIFIED_CONTAM: Partner of Y14 and mago [Sesamum angustifolium]|uniref:Partner of Y14 and mago n=1 Tax=Sesamum angustifolium TaxID=2727405 RepID=A0AAW2NZE1_9LAMI
MASSGNGGAEDASELPDELGKTLKEGERILTPTRRPDGTLRKPIRIRAGYVPQDEVAIYQSKGAIWRKEMSATQEVPPGYDQVVEPKPKSKSAKRNERKKEKRQQAALEKGKDSEQNDVFSVDDSNDLPENVESVSSKMNGLSLSGNASLRHLLQVQPSVQLQRIRMTEAQKQSSAEKDMKPEQLEKVAKLEGWQNELKLLEDKIAELTACIS